LDGLIEHPNISRPTHSQQIWRQKIFGCRSTSLEWPSYLVYDSLQPWLPFATFRRQLQTYLSSDRSA